MPASRGGAGAFPGRAGASARRREYLAATGRRRARPRGGLTSVWGFHHRQPRRAVRHSHDVQSAVVLQGLETVHEIFRRLEHERGPIGMATIVSIIVESTLYARRRGVSLGLCVEMTYETVEHTRLQAPRRRHRPRERPWRSAVGKARTVTIELQREIPQQPTELGGAPLRRGRGEAGFGRRRPQASKRRSGSFVAGRDL